jgi:hypothetical protein
MQSSLTKALNERDKAISAADSKLASDKARVNKDWMKFIGQKLTPAHNSSQPNFTGINITVNVGAGPAPSNALASAPPL